MFAYPCDRRTKQIEIDFTSVLSFWELPFLSPIVLPLKIQQWEMVNTQRKCGNDCVASVKISQKSEKKVQHKQKAWFKSFNIAIPLLFTKSVINHCQFKTYFQDEGSICNLYVRFLSHSYNQALEELLISYLIFVIFFTRAKFLENKIYTEKTRKLRQNTQKIANFLRYYGKIHSKLPIFRVKSVKIYTGQKFFTRIYSWRS